MKKFNKKPNKLERLIGNYKHEDSVSLRQMFQKSTVRKELRDNKEEDAIKLVTEILQSNKMTIVDAIGTFKEFTFLQDILLSHFQLKNFDKESILSFIDKYTKESYLYNAESKGKIQCYYLYSNRWHKDGNQKFDTKEEALEAFKEMIFLDGFRDEKHKAEYVEKNPMLDIGMNNIILGYEYQNPENPKWNLSTDILFSTFTELEDIKLAKKLEKRGVVNFHHKNKYIYIEEGMINIGYNGNIYLSKEDYENEEGSIDEGFCTLQDDNFNECQTEYPRPIEAIRFFKNLV